jgi:AAA family ATP:ADP antiporter
MLQRLLGSVAIRQGETGVAFLMFAYSFLAMTAHNIIRPLTRSKFIADLGADNIPYVELAAGVLIGVLMLWYSGAIRKLPRRHVIPITQAALVLLLILLWGALESGATWATVAFYFLSRITGVLLISQFWTLANDIYDARQAKRLFGFVGGGASLGGTVGGALTAGLAERIGTNSLVLVSAAVLAVCGAIVVVIVRRTASSGGGEMAVERGVGALEAIRLLGSSRQLRVLALVVGCAAAGATVVDQQLNMALEATSGGDGDRIARFLGLIGVYMSAAGFLVQVGLTSRIHRTLGISFALLLLPVGLGLSATLIFLTGALWAAGAARVLDSTMRYTVDKTTREVLFLPLAPDVRYRAKPFIDVTADRMAKALAAVLVLVLIKPWGLGLDWRQLSYASLALMVVWVLVALTARREYLRAFRDSIGIRRIEPGQVRTAVADAATIETLVEELANPNETAVLYAMDMLEAFEKRNLISPLLLQHSSPKIRARALQSVASTRSGMAGHWTATVERMVHDDDVDVRAAAIHALAALSTEDATTRVRRHLDDAEPRVVVAAAMILGASPAAEDQDAADRALSGVIADSRASAADGRRLAAAALAGLGPRFRPLLLPLMYDSDSRVVEEAIRSARHMGASDGLFLPALIALLGHRALKATAREALVGYGETAAAALAFVLHDRRESAWVRRHIPATLAQIPAQSSMDALVATLDDPDGFLRYKVVTAMESLRRTVPELTVATEVLEQRIVQEASRYGNYLTLRDNLQRERPAGAEHTLLDRALDDKLARALDRVYRLVGLLHGIDEVAGIRHAVEGTDQKRRAGALEYLDNVLKGTVRARVMPLVDDRPMAEKVRHANLVLKTRPRDLGDTLAQLVHDADDVMSATAIHFVSWQGVPGLEDDLRYVAGRKSSARVKASREVAVWALDSSAHDAEGSRPVVEIVDRIRNVALFDFISVDELFRIAEGGDELRHHPGRELFGAEEIPDGVYVLVEGTVAEYDADGGVVEHRAPAVLAFSDVVRGTPARVTARAVDHVMSIRVAAADFLTMVSDNPLLAQGLFRMLLTVDRGRALARPDRWLPASAPDAVVTRAPNSADQAILLRRHPLLSRAAADAVLALAEATEEVSFARGDLLVDAGRVPAVHLVLSGAVVMEASGPGPRQVGAGSTLGLAETLAGVASPWTIRAETDGQARRLSREALFAVLGDHVDLMQDLFGAVLAPSPS